MAIGRITGRMLKTPLERNSTDLVISTDGHANTLKIDATNGRIGIRHSSPSHGLTVDGIGLNDNVIETIDSNADLELRASGSGAVSISGIKHPTSDGTVGQFLKTDGAGNLSFADLSLGDLTITGSEIATPSNADLTLVPGGTGSVVINSISIRDNIIQTNESNANLQLSANGTGVIGVGANIVPTANETYSLGTSEFRFSTLHVASSTVYIGDTALSIVGGELYVDGNPVAGAGDAFPGYDGDYDNAKPLDQTASAETPFESGGTDAFGVDITVVFDCMDPVGQTVNYNYAAGEAYVGA